MKNGCENQNQTKKRSIELPVLKQTDTKKAEIRESRAGFWRAVSLIGLTVLMIAHYVQWQIMGKTVSPIEPSETMFTLQRGAVNAGFIFFILAILATLIFGRFVCGWGCHVLALQDFCAWLMKKIGLKPRPFRSRLLVFVPLIVALYMFVYPTVYRFFVKPPGEQLIPQFTNHIITTNFWETFPPFWVAVPFLFVCGFMTVYFLGSKGFCTYACPYGGFFGVADQLSPGKIRVTDDCHQCGHCTAVCTSNVIVHAEVKEYGMVVDPGCMKCMDCVSVCPNDALYFGFGKPALMTKKTVKKNYSLTWGEEIAGALVFFASFMAVWDVYQLVPMLMALGVAAVTTFLALRIWRLFRSADLSFFTYNLKNKGKIRRAGWIFLILSLLWLGLNVHSGWIHYLESKGTNAYLNIKIPDELALARTNNTQWLSQTERASIADTKLYLQKATSAGLLTNFTALPKLAWAEYLSGNSEEAVRLLGKASEHQEGQSKALSLYYRGTILNRLNRPEEARVNLEEALATRPDLVLAEEELGESLWRLNRREEAIASWREAAAQNKGLVLSNYFLAGAAVSAGQTENAAAFEKQAEAQTPNDPLFQWILGLRLENIGMNDLAEKHFQKAIQLNPQFKSARK